MRQLAGFVAARARLPRQEAGALVHRPPHRAGRGRGRVRGPRLAVDLRALPDRRRPRQGRSAAARQARGVRHLDDDAVDAARQPGRRRQPGARLRRDPARRRIPDRRGRPAPRRSWRRRASSRRRRRGSAISRDGLRALEGTAYTPPFPRPSADAKRDYRLWFARHATLEAGTGLVHTAPGHGADDYVVGREHGLPDLRARRRARALHRRDRSRRSWTGKRVFEANPKIVADLAARGLLLNKPGETVRHQYPHCWRCKNPIIFRATEQWFARLGDADDETSLRHRALAEIAQHAVDPGVGREPHPRHDRGAPRLVPVAPARLGRADPGVSLHEMREGSARRRGYGARGRDLRARGLERLVRAAGGRAAAARTRRPARCGGRDVREAARHRRRLVRVGRVVGGGGRGQAGAGGREGRPLPRRRGPAPRLVPLVAADRGGDARPGALQGGADARLGARRARQGLLEVGDREGARRGRQDRLRRSRPSGWRRTAPSCCACGPRPATTRATSSSRETILTQLGESYRKIRNTCRFLLSNLYDFVPSRDRLEDHELRELDLLALGVLRERDHQIFDGYKRYSFHEVVRLMNDYVDHACRPSTSTRSRTRSTARRPASRVRRSVQTALYEMIRTMALWMAPDPLLHRAGRRRRARRARPASRSTCTAPCASVDRGREARATRTSAGPTRSARGARRSCASWRRSAPPATSRWRRACA